MIASRLDALLLEELVVCREVLGGVAGVLTALLPAFSGMRVVSGLFDPIIFMVLVAVNIAVDSVEP